MPAFRRMSLAPERSRFLTVPIVALALLILLLGLLLWLLHRRDVETQKGALNQAVLWVGQTLRLHVTADEEQLRQMAVAIGDGAAAAKQAEQFLDRHPEIDSLSWFGPGGEPLLPESGPFDRAAFDEARAGGRPVYTASFPKGNGSSLFALYVPVPAQGKFQGVLCAAFSINALIANDVPWWYSRKYRVSVMDGAEPIARSASRAEERPAESATIAFDPPGHGLVLVADAYRTTPGRSRNLVAAVIVILAVGAIWSMLTVRRHARRRLDSERALDTEHAFRTAMENSLTVGLRARDLEGRIIYANPAFCQMIGWPESQLVGQSPPTPCWTADPPAPEGVEMRIVRQGGEAFDALIHEAPLLDSAGRQTGWMGSVVDITERKREEALARQQQEKLQQTARLIAMGEMASTLAHEMNQPLGAIASYCAGCLNLLEAGTYDPGELAEALRRLSRQAERAGEVVRRVRDFVRQREPVIVPCDIAAILEDSVAFIAPDAQRHGVTIGFAPPRPGRAVLADHILIEQVLLNLMRNAIEAMLPLSTGASRLDLSVERENGMACVRIADRGIGIPPERNAEIFSPFFTTKAEGMGMGLNICRSIVEFHHGRLWHERREGGGTLFCFTLPLAS